MRKARIVERDAPQCSIDSLVAAGFSPLKAKLLAERGVDAASLDAFLDPSPRLLSAPSRLPGINAAAEEIVSHISSPGRIVVFGDYDCDGICATAILAIALGKIAGRDKVAVFLPERLEEGYGMTGAALERMLSTYPDVSLVVTVDNGINSVDEVDMLKAMGVGVIVTDHHLPGDKLPSCTIANPRVDAPEDLADLCGAGVAFMLANALAKLSVEKGLYSGEKLSGPLIVLAGLATVTDIMPLKGQNRILVASALKFFRRHAPVGLFELYLRAATRYSDSLTAKDFAFLLGPRINAAGRMASGMEALELVLSEDREEARKMAVRLDLRNSERKTVEQEMTDTAHSQIAPGACAQVVSLPSAHQGVAGIVASRIMEKTLTPVCVIVDGHGSARAPEGYNLRSALEECSEALDRFGGHAAAAGLSVKDGMLDRFRELFLAACAGQRNAIEDDAAGTVKVDACFGESGFDPPFALEMAEWISSKLEPFGEENPEPVFAFRGVHVSEERTFGENGRHLQLKFREFPDLRAVCWNGGAMAAELRDCGSKALDVTFSLDVSDYGERHAELRVKEILASSFGD